MSIKFGSNAIDKGCLGSSEVDKVYLGSNVVYQKLATYTITATTTNVTASASNPSTITEGSTATLVFTANSGYKCPSTTPTVTGATVTSWTVTTVSETDDTGTLVISNPTGDVSFTVVGEAVSSSETWVINETPTISSTVSYEINFDVTLGSGVYNCSAINFSYSARPDRGKSITYTYSDGTVNAYNYYNDMGYGEWGAGDESRTLVFSTAPTGDLLTWLQANAVKQ